MNIHAKLTALNIRIQWDTTPFDPISSELVSDLIQEIGFACEQIRNMQELISPFRNEHPELSKTVESLDSLSQIFGHEKIVTTTTSHH